MSKMQKNYDINYILKEGNIYHAMFGNKYLGMMYIEIDGFYVFQFSEAQGCWAGWVLRSLAEKIEELNQPYIERLIKDGLWV